EWRPRRVECKVSCWNTESTEDNVFIVSVVKIFQFLDYILLTTPNSSASQIQFDLLFRWVLVIIQFKECIYCQYIDILVIRSVELRINGCRLCAILNRCVPPVS